LKTPFQRIQSALLGVVVLLCSGMPAFGDEKLADQAELYTGKEIQRAFSNPVDDPKLPRVLLIGDSISIACTVPVRKSLAGKANVHRIPGNGQTAENGAKNIDKWLGKKKWDVIHFNWGLWDLCYRHPAPPVSREKALVFRAFSLSWHLASIPKKTEFADTQVTGRSSPASKAQPPPPP
jgi:hypothetical protein